ncbi:uncharacterized protein LOC134274928 [Saccostrea cucullata]|uniref:uncharacterized protein LOC134274928 n=1 Tax=Saccostrea cuccullata TaxID=36930 RepID=UPI002ED45ED2
MAKFEIRFFIVLSILIQIGEGHLTGDNIEDEFIKLKSRTDQLEETTKKQSDQLSTLQETVSRLERTTQRQSGLISNLQRTNREYRKAMEKQTFKPGDREINEDHDSGDLSLRNLANCGRKMNSNKQRENVHVIRPTSKRSVMKFSGGNLITRKERFLMPLSTSPPTTQTVAFYAYMSSPVSNIGSHHVLVFDVVKTNVGNGFHQNAGVFIAPKSGVYVFYWNIRVSHNHYHSVELIVNKEQVGVFIAQSVSGQNFQGGNLAVVYVNQEDDVFVRTIANSRVGDIYNDDLGHSSFSGWLLL